MNALTKTFRNTVKIAVVLGLTSILGGCISGGKPFAYHPIHEIPRGPGLVSGDDGGYTIALGGHRETPASPVMKPAPRRAAQPVQPSARMAQAVQPAPRIAQVVQPPPVNVRMVESVTRQ